MTRTWIYLINPFLTAMIRNFKLALLLSTKHDAALAFAKDSSPFFTNLYATYHALHMAFDTAYANWKQQGGTQKGETLNLKQLLGLLAKIKIGDWERAIHEVYQPDSPQYMTLLPSLKAPFQTGDQLSRIKAVQNLGQALANEPSLATVKTSVDAFYIQLLGSSTTQKGIKSSKKMLRDVLEAQRLLIGVELLGNYALLLNHFKNTPENVAEFFDIPALRRAGQTLFTGKVKANRLHTIKEHTFITGENVRILNDGNVVLKFYLAQMRDGESLPPSVEIQVGETRIVTATQLGDIANTFIMVKNEQSVDGHFQLELL